MLFCFILLVELYIDIEGYCDRMAKFGILCYKNNFNIFGFFGVTGAFSIHSVYIMHLMTRVLGFYSVQTVFCHRHLPDIPRKSFTTYTLISFANLFQNYYTIWLYHNCGSSLVAE